MTYEVFDRSPDEPVLPSRLAATKNAKSKPGGQRPAFPPDQDIVLWLGQNAPTNFDELIDIRYSLYHRCSRAGYRVQRLNDEELSLEGCQSSLHIVSNQARRFLLTKLRELARENGWRGALPGSTHLRAIEGKIEKAIVVTTQNIAQAVLPSDFRL